MKYQSFLLLACISCLLSQEFKIQQTLFGKYQGQNFFCIVLHVEKEVIATPKFLDIMVEENNDTFDHFIVTTEEYLPHLDRNTFLKTVNESTMNTLRWYGKFKNAKKTSLQANLISLLQDKWQKKIAFEIELPLNMNENAKLFKEWGIARNILYRKYIALAQSNDYIKYGLVSSLYQFGIPVLIPETIDTLSDTDFTSFYAFDNIRNQFLTRFSYTTPPDITINTIQKIDNSAIAENSSNNKTFSLTKIIPEDYYFLHVSSPESIFTTIEKFANCKDDTYSIWNQNGKSTNLMDKLLGTLAIFLEKEQGGSSFGRDLLGWVMGDLAIVGSDFSYTDGTSYAIVVYVKSKFLLDMQLNKYFNDAKTKGAISTNITHQGVRFKKIIDRKRGIYCHTGYIDSFLVLSNSEKMFRKIIDTSANKNPSLAKSNDFQKMRSVFPADDLREDALFYISQAFSQKISSAPYQISRLRRNICIKNLNHLKYAILHYHNDYKNIPETVQTLKQYNIIFPKEILCPDSGEYSISSGKPTCSVHHQLEYLTPIDENSPEHIYSEEKVCYENFIGNFSGYENLTSSPIAVRSVPNPNIQLEVFTPGANLPYFNDIQQYIVADKNTKTTTYSLPDTFLSLNLFCRTEKILQNEMVKTYLQKINFSYLENLLPALGQQVSIHFCDDSAFIPGLKVNSKINPNDFAQLPFYITADIKNIYDLIATMDSLQADIYAYSVTKQNDIELVRSSHNKKDYYVMNTIWNGQKHKLFIGALQNFLVITNKKKILYSFLEEKFTAKTRQAPENIEILFLPQKIKKLRETLNEGGHEFVRDQCFANQRLWNSYKRFVTLPNVSKKTPDYFSSIDEQNLYNVLHYKSIVCPLGQKYFEQNFNTTCHIHGSHFHPLELNVQTIKEKSFIWPETSIRLKTIPEGIMLTFQLEIEK